MYLVTGYVILVALRLARTPLRGEVSAMFSKIIFADAVPVARTSSHVRVSR